MFRLRSTPREIFSSLEGSPTGPKPNKMPASLAGTLKSLPVRDEIAPKAGLAAFQAQIRRTAEPQAKPDSELRSVMNDYLHALRHDVRGGDTLLRTWAKRFAIAAVVITSGFRLILGISDLEPCHPFGLQIDVTLLR